MLPQFYQSHLQNYLSETQLITLKLLVWLLQNLSTSKNRKVGSWLRHLGWSPKFKAISLNLYIFTVQAIAFLLLKQTVLMSFSLVQLIILQFS
jgi:hypothetical protein